MSTCVSSGLSCHATHDREHLAAGECALAKALGPIQIPHVPQHTAAGLGVQLVGTALYVGFTLETPLYLKSTPLEGGRFGSQLPHVQSFVPSSGGGMSTHIGSR